MRARKIVTVVGVVAVVATAGVATAGWRVIGFTSSEVQAADPQLHVTAGSVHGLYPGGTVPTQLHVNNPNTFPVEFGTVALDAVTVDPDHSACPAGVLSVSFPNPHRILLPNASEAFEVGVSMSADAPQSCTGARFHVTYRAEGSVGSVTP